MRRAAGDLDPGGGGGSQLAPMRAPEFERFLHTRLPLAHAMGVGVVALAEDAVLLRAPLAPNVNPHATVFGGSASALAILAGWSLLLLRLQAAGVPGRLVIRRNTMEYEQPITGEFTARARLEHPERWAAFIATLTRRGRARVGVVAHLEQDGRPVGRFSGEFAGLKPHGSATLP